MVQVVSAAPPLHSNFAKLVQQPARPQQFEAEASLEVSQLIELHVLLVKGL